MSYDYQQKDGSCPICQQRNAALGNNACEKWRKAREWASETGVSILNTVATSEDSYLMVQALVEYLRDNDGLSSINPDQWAIEEMEHGLPEPYGNGPGDVRTVLKKDLSY